MNKLQMKVGFVPRELINNSLSYINLVAPNADSGSSRRGAFRGILEYNFGLEEVSFPKSGARKVIDPVYCITSRAVFWDFQMKDPVWEWFGQFLSISHHQKYPVQPWSHVKWPVWWLGP